MKRLLFVAGAAFVLALATAGLDRGDPALADAGNAIGVCCAWKGKLADGELTFKVSGGDAAAQQVVRDAVVDWDGQFATVSFREITGREKADVNIKFKMGGGQIQGQALRKFDGLGFVNSVDINVSGSAFGDPNNAATVGQITKHEFGHALGINHANFNGDLMSTTVSGGSSAISACDVNAVIEANHWFLFDGAAQPHQPHVNHVHC